MQAFTEKQIKLKKDILIALPFNLKQRFEKELKETENTYSCLGKWAQQAFNTRRGDWNDSISFCAGYICDE